MAALRRGSLFIPPLVQCRHRGKIHVRRPRQFFERRQFEAVNQLVTPDMLEKTRLTDCERVKRPVVLEEEQNLFEEFQVHQCKRMFNENEMVIVIQPDPMSKVFLKKFRNKLFHEGMEVTQWSNIVVQKAIADTKYANLDPLIVFHNLYIYSPEPKLKELLKCFKGVNSFHLLGGVVGDRLLTNADIKYYGSLGDLDTVRGQLCGLLSAVTGKTYHLLQSHQQQLTTNLSQYIKDRTAEESPNS